MIVNFLVPTHGKERQIEAVRHGRYRTSDDPARTDPQNTKDFKGKDGTASPARTGDPQIHNLVL